MRSGDARERLFGALAVDNVRHKSNYLDFHGNVEVNEVQLIHKKTLPKYMPAYVYACLRMYAKQIYLSNINHSECPQHDCG